MNEEKLDFAAERVTRFRSLSSGSRYRNDDIAKDIRLDMGKHSFAQGEGKHIGRRVLAAVLPIQSTHGPVTDKQNA